MHPLAGHWQANIEKSRRHPNHMFQRCSMSFTVRGDTVVLGYDGINMAGKQESSAQTLQADGVEYPVPQAPDVVSVCRWVGTHALETVGQRQGVVLGTGTYAVSDDGQTMTATVNGVDAQGKAFEQLIVFDRSSAQP